MHDRLVADPRIRFFERLAVCHGGSIALLHAPWYGMDHETGNILVSVTVRVTASISNTFNVTRIGH